MPRLCWAGFAGNGTLRLVLVLGLVALSVLSPFGCGCGGGIGGRGLETIKAIEAQDAERTAACFIPEIREEVTFSLEVVFAVVDEIRISNVTWQVLSETGETATVDVGLDWEASGLGQTRSGHAQETIDLEKVGGEWLINSFAPFQWLLDEVLAFER
jgi:hypothetical protein